MKRRPAQQRRGLTLIETALATIIVGVGVLAIVVAQQAFHTQNAWSNRAATATRLGNEIREMTLNLPRHDPVLGTAVWGPETGETTEDYNDLDDFDSAVFSAAAGTGPLNARREIIPNMQGWAQSVTVDMVDPFDINSAFEVPEDPLDYPTRYLMRIEVTVTFQEPGAAEPEEVTRVSWVSPN